MRYGGKFRRRGRAARAIRLGVLVSHPIQYFVPVYQELAAHPDIEFTVLFRTRVGVDKYDDAGFGQAIRWDIPLLEGYRHVFLSTKRSLNGIEVGIVLQILRRRFDVLLVHGYNNPTNLLAMGVAKLVGTRLLIRGDTRIEARHAARFGRRLMKRSMFRMIDGFVCIGTLNRAYYAAHGVTPKCLFFAPFCVDSAAFRLDPVRRLSERQRRRKELGLSSEAVVVLFAGKLVAQKRADDLIRAFAQLRPRYPGANLVIAGSGKHRAVLERLAVDLALTNVCFVGFQNQSELPSLYAASDVFVLPSGSEAWGLAVNEVMAAGLPVVVSDEVGAAPDLVQDKGTGIVYPCGNVDALADALQTLIVSKDLRVQMGERASRLIASWGIPQCASGIAEAARAVLAW